MDCKYSIKMAIGTLAILMPWSAHAAFECPTQPLEAARAATIAASLPTGDAFDDRVALSTTVTALQAEGVSMPMIVDNLISAYCPTVSDMTGLSDAEKTAKVNQFAARITRTVYQLDDANSIILDVNFPPLVVDAINAKAKEAGVSATNWIEAVVKQALN